MLCCMLSCFSNRFFELSTIADPSSVLHSRISNCPCTTLHGLLWQCVALSCVVYLFSWSSLSEAIESRLTELIDCHEKWTDYEKHRIEVTERISDVERHVGSLFGRETGRQHEIDRIHVCVMFY